MSDDPHDQPADFDDISGDNNADEMNPYELAPMERACPRCGRRLTDLPEGAPCPDCPRDSDPVRFAPARSLAGHVCLGCGYALDGLRPDGICPECGLPVQVSLTRDLLAHSDPTFVQSLVSGSLIVFVTTLISAGLTVLAVVASAYVAITSAAAGNAGATYQTTPVDLVFSLLSLANGLAGVYGWWLLSAPDPRLEAAHQGTIRGILRASLVAVALTWMLSAAFQFVALGQSPTSNPGLLAGLAGVGLLSIVAWVAMFVASMLYLKGIAARIPDQIAERRAGTYTWLLPLIYVLGSCIVVGPIAAVIMYAILVYRVWKDLAGIASQQALRGHTFGHGPT